MEVTLRKTIVLGLALIFTFSEGVWAQDPDVQVTPMKLSVQFLNNVSTPDASILGRGVNMFSGDLVAKCVYGKEQILDETAGGRVEYRLSQARTTKELLESFELNASAGGAFGMSSGKFSLAISNSMTRNVDETYVLVHTKVIGPEKRLEDPASDSLLNRRTQSDERFYRECGNRYISSVQLGAEFRAMIKIIVSNAEDRRALNSALDFKTQSTSSHVDFAKKLQEIVKQYRRDIIVDQVGLLSMAPKNWEVDTLINYALGFATEVHAKKQYYVTGIVTSYYDHLYDRSRLQKEEVIAGIWADSIMDLRRRKSELESYALLPAEKMKLYAPPIGADDAMARKSKINELLVRQLHEFEKCMARPNLECGKLSIQPEIGIAVPRLMQQLFVNPNSNTPQLVGVVPQGQVRALAMDGYYRIGHGAPWVAPDHLDTVLVDVVGTHGNTSYRTSYREGVKGPLKAVTGPANIYTFINDNQPSDNASNGLRAYIY